MCMGVWPHNEQRTPMLSTWNYSYRSFDPASGVPRGSIVIVCAVVYMGVWPNNKQRTTVPSTWNCGYSICRYVEGRFYPTTSSVPLCYPRGTIDIVCAVVYRGVWPHNEQNTTMPSACNYSYRSLCRRSFDTRSGIQLCHPRGTRVIA